MSDARGKSTFHLAALRSAFVIAIGLGSCTRPAPSQSRLERIDYGSLSPGDRALIDTSESPNTWRCAVAPVACRAAADNLTPRPCSTTERISCASAYPSMRRQGPEAW